MSASRDRSVPRAGWPASGQAGVKGLLRSPNPAMLAIPGGGGLARFCDAATERGVPSGATKATMSPAWLSEVVGVLDEVYIVRALVGVDGAGLYHPAMSVAPEGKNGQITWGSPRYTLGQAKHDATDWLKASALMGVKLRAGHPSIGAAAARCDNLEG